MNTLTNREKEVALLVREGLCNREIADRLYVSTHTVKAVLEHIYDKLHLNNRVQLAIFVLKQQMLEKS